MKTTSLWGRRKRRLYGLLSAFLAVFIIALIFSLYTNHAWEDWYITYRCAKNLATGNGLVFTPGERVHAFTSPLGTLIPATFNIVTRNISDDLVLWLMRVLGAALLGASAILLVKITAKIKPGIFSIIFLLTLFSSNIHILDFSINGMESGLMIFFLTFAIYALNSNNKHAYLYLGIAGAGLMWTRPDGFIYWGGICLGHFLFGLPEPYRHSLRARVIFYLRSGVLMFFLYLPWVIWSQNYYGSFVPHTIIAKGLNNNFSQVLHKLITRDFKSIRYVFMPPYYSYGGWNAGCAVYMQLLAWAAALYWLVPFGNRRLRAISLAVLFFHAYLSLITHYPHPWYLPMAALLSIITIAAITQDILNSHILRKERSRFKRRIFIAILLMPLVINLSLACLAAYQLRIRQQTIEDGNRRQIGLWLKEKAASPEDTVFLEPLGYIGFFSQLRMYDYPGLSSPKVIAVRKNLKSNNFAKLINELNPDWLCLRPIETKLITKEIPGLLTETYEAVKVFDVSPNIKSYSFLPGRQYLEFDQVFTVFKKRR